MPPSPPLYYDLIHTSHRLAHSSRQLGSWCRIWGLLRSTSSIQESRVTLNGSIKRLLFPFAVVSHSRRHGSLSFSLSFMTELAFRSLYLDYLDLLLHARAHITFDEAIKRSSYYLHMFVGLRRQLDCSLSGIGSASDPSFDQQLDSVNSASDCLDLGGR